MVIRKWFALSQDVMTIHGRVGDGGVAGRRGQACHRHLCGVESGEVTEVLDAGLHPDRPEEVNFEMCRQQAEC